MTKPRVLKITVQELQAQIFGNEKIQEILKKTIIEKKIKFFSRSKNNVGQLSKPLSEEIMDGAAQSDFQTAGLILLFASPILVPVLTINLLQKASHVADIFRFRNKTRAQNIQNDSVKTWELSTYLDTKLKGSDDEINEHCEELIAATSETIGIKLKRVFVPRSKTSQELIRVIHDENVSPKGKLAAIYAVLKAAEENPNLELAGRNTILKVANTIQDHQASENDATPTNKPTAT